MNIPAENRERSVTALVRVEGTDRSPVHWPLVVAALLMAALAIATVTGIPGLL